jgi:glc operon protein GlcG
MTRIHRPLRLPALVTAIVALAAVRALSAPADPGMSLALAKRVVTAATAEAARVSAPGGAIAIVDEGGHLVYLERLDGTFPAAATVSNEKARTAALFRQPTANLENAIRNGRNALLGVSVMTPLQGGVPIAVDGRVIGAIGVSGAASAQQDTEIAEAAVKSLTAPAPAGGVLHLGRARVDAAFARGEPLTETPLYKVHASRRDAPGVGEVHVADTDIIHVLSGRATLTTGGELVDAEETAPFELRGPRIAGGTRRAIAAGDVVVVPAGVPHWFEEVDGPVTYYVVKATAAETR